MNTTTFVESSTPLETRPLIWKGMLIDQHYIRNDGVLFKNDRQCSRWKINGHNYSVVEIDGRNWTYRIDYMVAYTFLGMRPDSIRLIHINEDIADDRIDNLMWYRKVDVMKEYQDLAIVESDGSIKEEWKPCITEYNPSLGYEVSNLGLIRDSNHVLIPIHESHGYRVFYYLDQKFAKQTRIKSVHRAVAEAFIPNPNKYELVNHLDGDKFNDVVMNLEWASAGMNMEHAYLQGLNRKIQYTETQISAVCELLTKGVQQIHISYMTGVDRKTVSDVYRGRRWKDISSRFEMPKRKWTPELKTQICNMIIAGNKGADIFDKLGIKYDQSAISFYERMRRELKSAGKI